MCFTQGPSLLASTCIQVAGRGQLEWGVSTDEGMVKGIPLHNSLFGLPNNTLMLACPQVDKNPYIWRGPKSPIWALPPYWGVWPVDLQ